jgi:hypothetical protein
MRPVPLLLLAAAALAVGGCTEPATPNRAGPTSAGSPVGTPAPAVATPAPTGANPTERPPAPRETPAVMDYRISYGWGVPSNEVTVDHPLRVPIAPPPAPPLPYLEAIYVADHPEGSPKYSRISFYFRGALPSYRLQYVRQILSDGQGTPISLEGNSFLRIVFANAQAHDSAGRSTVHMSPKSHIGFANLKSYGFGGDFEGYVTYGLGIQVAPNSDRVLAIRAGELTRSDGSGGVYNIVHIDIRHD